MTRLALGAKCGSLASACAAAGAIGCSSPASASGAMSEPRAVAPSPAPMVLAAFMKNRLRVMEIRCSSRGSMGIRLSRGAAFLVLAYGGIGAEHGVAHHGPRRQLGGGKIGRDGGLADADQGRGVRGRGGVA